jgi:hypothetical protein
VRSKDTQVQEHHPEAGPSGGYGKGAEGETASDSDDDDTGPMDPPSGYIHYRSITIPDPALKEKRKAKAVDPDFTIHDLDVEEDDSPLISQRRKRIRRSTPQLTIGDGKFSVIVR